MERQARTAKPSAGRQRRRGRRPGLSREQIARAALELVDREGLDALTMQRLAEQLGVGTMTVYGYFRRKEELLDAIIDAAVEDARPPPRTGPWRKQLRELVRFAHQRLGEHPALVQLRLREPVVRPEALRFGEAALAILHQAGFDSTEAARSFRLLFTYVVGYAALSPADTTEEQRRQAAAAIALLPEDEYPNLNRAAGETSKAMAGEEAFDFGLERILDGLEARQP
jgi:TetR/AcrR family tetracycline transcriptional repressor